jgi:cytochrome c peroxidase
MFRRSASPDLILRGKAKIARPAHLWGCIALICVLVLGGLWISTAIPQPLAEPPELNSIIAEEPITPIPSPPPIDSLKVRLGERLFGDPRLSRGNSRSCSSCHDLSTNGASKQSYDKGVDGSNLPLNTPSVFNSALSFRFGWEGKIRTIESDVKILLQNPQIMDADPAEIAEKLDADSELRREFVMTYGSRPDAENVVDALASFQRTLLTPGSHFDRWLEGDTGALSTEEVDGYRLFKSLGCVSCHQGVNVGGNLFERHGIFHPLASPKPEILRVPSLRNVATTPPYFHDGSAATLHEAVRKMGLAQLNSTLTDQQISAIVAFLHTLTGNYRGVPVRDAP